jgi:hypothetical protein
MNNLVKEYMETGKDLNTICNDKIKANNRQWFLIFCLFSIIWIGHSVIQYKRVVYFKSKVDTLSDSIKFKDAAIDMQKKCLDSAVYFEDIK